MTQKVSIVAVFMGLLLFGVPALAEDGLEDLDLSLGAGVRLSTSEYRDGGLGISPVPLIHYEGDYFYVRGLTAGVPLFREEDMGELSLTASYLSQSFDADDSDDRTMRRLDDRDSSMTLGAAYRLDTGWGIAKLSFAADVLDTSNGFIGDVSYLYPFRLSALQIKPEVGVEWTSGDYNDYYYGVSAVESGRSGLREYEADGGFSPYLGLGLKIGLFEDVDLTMGGKAKLLSEEITDSPMVDRDVKYSFGAGITYSF